MAKREARGSSETTDPLPKISPVNKAVKGSFAKIYFGLTSQVIIPGVESDNNGSVGGRQLVVVDRGLLLSKGS
jgi:hypothetical protein